MIQDVILKSAIEVCGTAVVGRMSGDAWWNDEIQTAAQERKEEHKGKLTITGLSDQEKNRLKSQ